MSKHPITPPPELVQQWYRDADHQLAPYYVYVAHCAAQWGADQELEACVNWLADPCAADMPSLASDLRYSRRPNPPRLKEALEALERMQDLYPHMGNARTIRRALEAL
jgi:hypothetical protein